MVKRTTGVFVALGATLALIGAGCGGSDPKQAQTPTNAPTVSNSTAPTATTGATTEGGGSTEAKGDAAAGKTFFEGTCQACHPAGGTEAGAGPKLQGAGLTADAITTQIKTPKGTMPPNLASGADLENVTAYVLSLK